jgi:hypothetical protein
MYTEFLLKILKGSDHSRDLGIDGRINICEIGCEGID